MKRAAVCCATVFWIAVSSLSAGESTSVVVELRDGSSIHGTLSPPLIRLRTDTKERLDVPLNQVQSVTLAKDRETVQVVRHSGQKVAGVLDSKEWDFATVLGKLKLHAAGIRRLETINLDKGLIAHWNFDMGFIDRSGNRNHGEKHGGVTIADGIIGRAAYFDGKDGFIKVEPKSDVSAVGDFSVSMWFKLDDWKEQRGRLADTPDRHFLLDTMSDPDAPQQHGAGTAIVLDDVDDGRITAVIWRQPNWLHEMKSTRLKGHWRHIAYTRRGNHFAVYLDGRRWADYERKTNGDVSEKLDMRHTWYLGTFFGNNPKYAGIGAGFNFSFHGWLDDVRIYGRALGVGEVQRLYRMAADE